MLINYDFYKPLSLPIKITSIYFSATKITFELSIQIQYKFRFYL